MFIRVYSDIRPENHCKPAQKTASDWPPSAAGTAGRFLGAAAGRDYLGRPAGCWRGKWPVHVVSLAEPGLVLLLPARKAKRDVPLPLASPGHTKTEH